MLGNLYFERGMYDEARMQYNSMLQHSHGVWLPPALHPTLPVLLQAEGGAVLTIPCVDSCRKIRMLLWRWRTCS